MPTDYIPTREPELVTWVTNFAVKIDAAEATYGLVAGDATAINAVVNPFLAAYTLANNPATRTTPAIADKDAKKAAMLVVVRSYAQEVKQNDGVDDVDKADIGLNIDDPTPTPIPAPVTVPILSVISAGALTHTVRYADETTPDARKKPDGVIHLELRRTIATAEDTDPMSAAPVANFTKQPVLTEFDDADRGKVATYFGRWVTRRGLAGPWSAPVSFRIA